MDLDKFDYKFAPVKFEWGLKFDVKLSNKDLMDLLIKTAIEAKNEDYGTQLEFVEYVIANVTAAQFLFLHNISSPMLVAIIIQSSNK
uniref:Uncharacterized protein n=1 Tax=Brassica oleracea TaxID=3712 RepID=A0A3P6F454_BRAOL|nr:unnamed protein product [Brassica oleracea]